jgi:type III restriction enzyme
MNGRLELFRNFDEHGNPLPRPNTILVDSEQLESGEGLDDNFRKMAADEIDRFRREIIERTGDRQQAENISDNDLLREVMNRRKVRQLGEAIRCVVSVSMLTEGWDANTVTHVLGVRAFGTQLLCEQVVGRALRRQSYDLNEEDLFNADSPTCSAFRLTSPPSLFRPQEPRETVVVRAVRPERDHLEIRFPRVEGYRVELPADRLKAEFNAESILELTPELVGPSITRNAGIIGEGVDLTLEHLDQVRHSTVVFHVAKHLLYSKWRDPGEEPKLHLFGQLKRITKEWIETCLVCKGGTYPAQLLYQELADMAANKITAGITAAHSDSRPIKAVLDPYNPTGSTRHVLFNTSRTRRWETDSSVPRQLDCSRLRLRPSSVALPKRPQVRAYVKNHNLGPAIRIATGRRSGGIFRTSSCWSTTVTAPTTCCT